MNDTDRQDRKLQDQELEQHARQVLDDSLDDLSPEVQQKLRMAREQALGASKPEARRLFGFGDPRLVWGGVVAAALAVIAITGPLRTSTELVPLNDAESFLALAELDQTEWELLQDELEFAYWLSELAEEDLAQENAG